MTESASTAGTLQTALRVVNENAERYLIYVAYSYLMLVVVTEVGRRFLLNFASLWGNASAQYLFIYLTYVGMSWAVYKRVHIRIDVLYHYVSDRVEDYLYVFSDLVMIAFALITIRFSLPIIRTSIRYSAATQALRLNRAFFQFAVVLGFLLFTIRCLQRLYDDIMTIRSGSHVYKGIDIFVESE
ncbi:MAG: TRAP transporter small permease [Halodesulfurarchaeum sp.]